MKHGYAGYIGTGAPVESQIHVKDLARAYVVLLHHMEASPPIELLINPYYFCESTGDHEPSWKEIAETIGQGLHKAGKISDATPKSVEKELWGDLFGDLTPSIIGLNSRSRALRLRELGWSPQEKDWRASFLEDELSEIIKEDCGSFSGYKA